MAFTNQATSSLADFISKLNTFLAANGWTTHHVPASGEFAARRLNGAIDVGFASQWDTGTPEFLGVYQWHGAAYNAGNSPWAQNDDSGNGFAGTTNASLAGQRFAWITNTPVQFWAFADADYFYVVLQRTTIPDYVHFGAGFIEKFGDQTWIGGEFVFGHRQQFNISTNPAILNGTSVLLDGQAVDAGPPQPNNMEEYAATIRAESLLNQPAGGKWAVVMGNQNAANLGQDRQTVPVDRIHFAGGFRAGLGTQQWGPFYGNPQQGLLPGYPILTCHWDRVSDAVFGPMGRMPDVRGMSIKDYSPGDTITVAGDDWLIFPTAVKWPGSGSLLNTSANQGIIYKVVP